MKSREKRACLHIKHTRQLPNKQALLQYIATDAICMVVLKYEEQDYHKTLAKAPAHEAQTAVSHL